MSVSEEELLLENEKLILLVHKLEAQLSLDSRPPCKKCAALQRELDALRSEQGYKEVVAQFDERLNRMEQRLIGELRNGSQKDSVPAPPATTKKAGNEPPAPPESSKDLDNERRQIQMRLDEVIKRSSHASELKNVFSALLDFDERELSIFKGRECQLQMVLTETKDELARVRLELDDKKKLLRQMGTLEHAAPDATDSALLARRPAPNDSRKYSMAQDPLNTARSTVPTPAVPPLTSIPLATVACPHCTFNNVKGTTRCKVCERNIEIATQQYAPHTAR